MIDVLIHSPYPRQESQGNSTSADRLEKMLLEQKFSVAVETEWYGGTEARTFIALNARRSAGAVEEFRDACPDSQIIIVLTGTDINHPEIENPTSRTREAMQVADRLVLLHEGSLPLVPADLQEKCQIIYPSVALPEGLKHELKQKPDNSPFHVIMAGNVRAEKNIPVVLDACALLPKNSPISISLYGDSEDALAQKMRLAEQATPCFRWMGKTSHHALMQKMASADLLLNSSTQEGGSNAICEAISMGLPVVASQISGNVGMLGADYAGYFPSGDAWALKDLLQRCAEDQAFYLNLKKQIQERAPLFSYSEEARLWGEILDVAR